ncbi:MAG: 4Fe-4S dicluster domain-containing protein [Mycobacteriales bacterium]
MSAEPDAAPVRWLKVLDQTKCIGCHACTTACKSENEVPLGVTRTYVKSVDVGLFPDVRRNFQVTRCNQCTDAPCVAACPTEAMFRRDDGIVDFDKSVCIGCKACMAACPYDAIFINPEDHSAEKCNLCAHRLDVGLEPACVTVCPTEAILVGDANDPDSAVAEIVRGGQTAVRKPEKHTHPNVHYRGAGPATLDPLAARRPDGGLFAWATQGAPGPQFVAAGNPDPLASRDPQPRHPQPRNPEPRDPEPRNPEPHDPESHDPARSQAAALLSYDVPHHAPWGWRVSLYTFTKSIAAGALLDGALLAFAGRIDWTGSLIRFAAPLVALGFLGITGVLLIIDLKHPARFYLIFTRPQWRSWLVRGGFIIGGYGAAGAGMVVLAVLGSGLGVRIFAAVALPLAIATACYTAYLFAQATARDLWQSALLAPHLAVQAVLAGAAVLLPFCWWLSGPTTVTGYVLVAAVLVHLALVAAETTGGHGTEHRRLAVRELVHGRFARPFAASLGLVLMAAALALTAIGVGAPWIGPLATPFALLGLLAYEHAYVQAGQSVPLS